MDFATNNKAIYLQIADDIADKVLSGEYEADKRIPSVREYAAMVAVNVNTVMRAYELLSQTGVLYNKRGLGFFVAPDAPQVVADRRKAEFIDDELPRLFRRLSLLGLTPRALAGLYENYLNDNQN